MISHWRDKTPAPGPSTQRRVSYFFFFFLLLITSHIHSTLGPARPFSIFELISA